MADLNTRYAITVNRTSATLSRAGFGEPLIFGYIDTGIIPVSQRTRRYSLASFAVDMVADGFATTDPVYLAMAQVAAQTPRPATAKVGRGALDYTHAVELEILTDTSGETILVTITKGTTSRSYERACAGGGIAAEATAVAALMNADASGWGTAGTGELTIAGVGTAVEIDAVSPANDNEMWYYDGLQNAGFTDVGTDRGMSTDLTAVAAYDNDWWGLVLADSFGATEIAAAATWAESNKKLLCAATQDYTNASAGTGIASTLASASRDYTNLTYTPHALNQYPGAAVAGRFLPLPPGEIVWANKTLSGVTAATLTTAQISNLETDKCNYHDLTKGVGVLFKGFVSSGEFVDTIRLTDWTVTTVQEELLALALSVNKIPFTDAGVSQIEGVIRNVLRRKMPLAFEQDSDFFFAPKVADVSVADKSNRVLPDVVFGATFAGAIMTMTITANLAI